VELRRTDARVVRLAARDFGFSQLKCGARLPHLSREPRGRWVSCLSLYLRARLLVALRQPDAVPLLCRQRARIEADGDRLTATFALADHLLALRLAGLDRNPGWVPAAGRIVEFAFE
jgi:hypothetical protein